MPDEMNYPTPDRFDELSGHDLAKYVLELGIKHGTAVYRLPGRVRIWMRNESNVLVASWGLKLAPHYYLTHKGVGRARRRFLTEETTPVHCTVLEIQLNDDNVRTMGRHIDSFGQQDHMDARRMRQVVAPSATPA